MLDRRFIRENMDKVDWAVRVKKDTADLEKWAHLDEEIRNLKRKGDELRQESNTKSKTFGKLMASGGDDPELASLKERLKDLKDEIADVETREKEAEAAIRDIELTIPNIPHPTVPEGESEEQNEEIRTWGEVPSFDFEAKTHHDLIDDLHLVDFERGAKVTGSGFPLYYDQGARLTRGLINYMLDLHTTEHGYTEVSPPFIVNRDTMIGTGQIPKLEEDMYRTVEDGFYLIPTAEVPVTNIHAGEILKQEELPRTFAAYTPCFRREAGAHGKDTRGLIRVHQFDKVELVRIVEDDTSWDEHELLLGHAETVLQQLGIRYRVVSLSTGDLSFAASKCYDLEAWAPISKRWFEVSSCSNFTDFQARRADLRYRDEDGDVRHCHTLNASGLALPRVIICLLETHQTEDGRVALPEPLPGYMGGRTHLEPPAA